MPRWAGAFASDALPAWWEARNCDKPSVLCRVQGRAAADALRGEHIAANEALVGAIKTAPSRSGVKLVDSMYSQDKTENIIIGRKDTRAQRGTHPAHTHLSHDGTKQRERPAKHTLTHTHKLYAGRAQGARRACSGPGYVARVACWRGVCMGWRACSASMSSSSASW